jgi:MFS family permease
MTDRIRADSEHQAASGSEGAADDQLGSLSSSTVASPLENPPLTVQVRGDGPEAAPVRATFRTVLGRPAVRALWLASLISYVGDTFGIMALFILVNHITHSTVALATVGVVQTIPLLLALVAGLLVDRWRYRPVLLCADLVRAALLPFYLLFQTPEGLWIVLIVTLGVSVASRFFFPASQALRRALLEPEEYAVAASLWQATFGLSYVVGPALAGLVISAFGANVQMGASLAFLLDSLSFGISALLIFVLVREKAQAVDAARQREDRPGAWADLKEGWEILWRSRPIRGVVTLYGVGLLGVGAVFVLTVPYVQRAFGGGPMEIGLLEASQALGLAIGATAVGTVLARKLPAGQLMLLASVTGGAAVVGLGVAPVYAAALAVMCVAGAAAGAVESAGAVVTLQEIPQRHQGKGNASINTLLNASYLTSIALSGVGGELLGIRGTFIAGGLLALLGVVLALPLLGARRDSTSRAASELASEVGDPGNIGS